MTLKKRAKDDVFTTYPSTQDESIPRAKEWREPHRVSVRTDTKQNSVTLHERKTNKWYLVSALRVCKKTKCKEKTEF